LEVHFFKRLTGAYGGGQGANGQILNWSNTVGTHPGRRAGLLIRPGGPLPIFPSPICVGRVWWWNISDLVGDYDLYTPEMIMKKATVKPGDILIIKHGYHRYSWDKPDVFNRGRPGRR